MNILSLIAAEEGGGTQYKGYGGATTLPMLQTDGPRPAFNVGGSGSYTAIVCDNVRKAVYVNRDLKIYKFDMTTGALITSVTAIATNVMIIDVNGDLIIGGGTVKKLSKVDLSVVWTYSSGTVYDLAIDASNNIYFVPYGTATSPVVKLTAAGTLVYSTVQTASTNSVAIAIDNARGYGYYTAATKVVRFDPSTGSAISTIAMGSNYKALYVEAKGSVITCSISGSTISGRIYRIDPTMTSVTTGSACFADSIAVHDSGLLVLVTSVSISTTTDTYLFIVDPVNLSIVNKVLLDDAVGHAVFDLLGDTIYYPQNANSAYISSVPLYVAGFHNN